MTLLISFGGYGSAVAAKILDHLDGSGSPIQSIVLCGRNDKLLASLTGRPRCHAVGFTDRVADYMRIADVFVGKPGPVCGAKIRPMSESQATWKTLHPKSS